MNTTAKGGAASRVAMNVVFTHHDPLRAQEVRDRLLERGILAAVVDRSNVWFGAARSYDVMLCYGVQYDEARAVLAQTDDSPGHAAKSGGSTDQDADHEDGGWQPDLTQLGPDKAPLCPACGVRLPLDAGLGSCPACRSAVDVVDLIVQRHGPEALDGCYPREESSVESAMIERMMLLCPTCRYSLDGMPRVGTCPECGEGFDKVAIVRDFLGG